METVSVRVPVGKHYFYKVRCYNEIDGETIYSDFSNIVDYDNTLSNIEITRK